VSDQVTACATKEIHNTCLRLLTLREHSRHELLQKLSLKGYIKDDILAVVDELAEQGWQSDQRYAECYARYRIQKGFGPIMIAYELKQNGISYANFDLALTELDTTWQQLLAQVYLKKYKQAPISDRNEWVKRSRFLFQRGFSSEMISELLSTQP
jgi:regulatory protein